MHRPDSPSHRVEVVQRPHVELTAIDVRDTFLGFVGLCYHVAEVTLDRAPDFHQHLVSRSEVSGRFARGDHVT